MVLRKCSRPRQKWAHHFISLKVLSTAEQDIGKEEPSWKGLERKESLAATVSSSQERAMLCKETWAAESCCSGKDFYLVFPSLDKQVSPAALSCSSSPLQPSWDCKQSWKTNHHAQCCKGGWQGEKRKHTNSCMEKQLQCCLKNWACMFLGRKYSEMCCCSSLILPICNSLWLRNTSRYVSVEDILFSYSTVALK